MNLITMVKKRWNGEDGSLIHLVLLVFALILAIILLSRCGAGVRHTQDLDFSGQSMKKFVRTMEYCLCSCTVRDFPGAVCLSGYPKELTDFLECDCECNDETGGCSAIVRLKDDTDR